MMEKVYVQHDENQKWMKDLQFFDEEIKVMKKRLEEIASKNTAKNVLATIEHFQNQLIVQKDNIDKLKHEVNLSEDLVKEEIKKNKVAVDHREINDHSALRKDMTTFEKTFKDFKTELNLFLIKWM